MSYGTKINTQSSSTDPRLFNYSSAFLFIKNVGTFEYLSSLNQIDLSIQVLTKELNRRTRTTDNTSLSFYTDALLNSLIVTFSIPAKPFVNNNTQFTGVLAVDVTENLIQQIVIKAKVKKIPVHLIVTFNLCIL